MPLLPPPTSLPRLEIPSKGLLWRTWHRLKSHSSRRLALSRTINDLDIDDDERLSRMRTLIDIGLWGDHSSFIFSEEFSKDRHYMGYDVVLALRAGLCTPQVVHMLMEAGVDPNWRENNKFDDSLLTLFARHSQKEPLKVVLAAGADPRLRDSCGNTALHIVMGNLSKSNDEDVHANLLPIAQHLIAAGADINDPGERRPYDNGSPPIRTAIEEWNVKMTQWALDQGASLDVKDQYEETPFHWAATIVRGWTDVPCTLFLDFLLANGARLDEPNKRGETPLWQALDWRNPDVAEWLVDHGANIHVVPHTFRDSQGYETPGRKGAPLLQLLCEEFHCEDDTVGLAQKLAGGDRNAWNVMTTQGKPLAALLEEEGSSWCAFAQADQLETTTKPIDHVVTPNRKLRL